MVVISPEQHPNLFSTKPHPHRAIHIFIGVAVAFVTISLLIVGYVYRTQFMASESPPDIVNVKEEQLEYSLASNLSQTLTTTEINLKDSQIKSVSKTVNLTPDQVAKKRVQLSQQ